MIRIEVTSEVNVKTGTGSKPPFRPYEIHEQTCFAHLVGRDGQPQKYPQRIVVNLDKNERGEYVPFPPGDYTLAPTSFYVGDFASLMFRPRLVPARGAVQRAA